MPLLGVKKAVVECEKLYETFGLETYDLDSGSVIDRTLASVSQPPESRVGLVRIMAECAAFHLIHTFKSRLDAMVEDAVEDGTTIGKTILLSTAGRALKEKTNVNIETDSVADIKAAGDRAATREMDLLRSHIEGLPHIIAQTKLGRKKGSFKSQKKRAKEAAEFESKIENVAILKIVFFAIGTCALK